MIELDTDTDRAYEYKKNTRTIVPKGTRAASAVVSFSSENERRAAQALALDESERRWRLGFGGISWDMMELVVWHMTASVLVELREVQS